MQMWLERASRFIVWVIGVAIILDIFGIKIGPLVAGLGLFSVAVALGAQDFFKNLRLVLCKIISVPHVEGLETTS